MLEDTVAYNLLKCVISHVIT